MLSSAWLSLVLLGWLVVFLKLLADLSKSYGRLLEIRRSISAVLQERKRAKFEKIEAEEKLKLAEQVVDKGTSVVQDVHKTVSDITFDVLENIPVTSSTSQIVRKVHDETAGGVYTTVRALGRQISGLARGILALDSSSEQTVPSEPDEFEAEE